MPATFQDLVSAPRFSKYLRVAGGDQSKAEALYDLNLQISGAAYTSIQMFEVILRNSMDEQLRIWNNAQGFGSDWTLTTAPILKMCFSNDADDLARAAADASKAVNRSRRNGEPKRNYTHDDVVAQMSLGGWRYLLPPNKGHMAKDRIWEEALKSAFPNKNQNVPVASLVKWVSMIYDLRNRVAHHEPVFHLDMAARRRAMKDVLDAISRDARTWFVARDQFQPAITQYNQFASKEKLKL